MSPDMSLDMNIGTRVDRDQARQRARDILSAGRFRRVSVRTRPTRPTWFDRHVSRPLGRFVGGVIRSIGGLFSTPLGLLVLVCVVAVLGVWIGRRVAESQRAESKSDDASLDDVRVDPDQLDRDAAAAERSGDFGRAVRLRFRAGLARLQRAGVVDNRASVTSAQVSRNLHSPTFDGLARTFDGVVYGSVPAEPVDASVARDDWPKVVQDASA